jgi:hypothetical protein
VAGHFVVAKPVEQSKDSELSPTQPDGDFSQADMGIYGWHAPHIDTTQTQLICLNASWKADWL